MQPPFGGTNPLLVAGWLFERTRAATMCRGALNEATRDPRRHVSALDPPADASRDGRHRPRDFEGRALKHRAAGSRGLAVRYARAPRAAIGARPHAARRAVR